MPPIISSRLTQQTSMILCYYCNSTDKIQLIRVWNGTGYSLEKIVFPQQRILFEAKAEGILEVHTKPKDQQLLEQIYSCLNLKINQPQFQLVST